MEGFRSLRFGAFELDEHAGELRKGGTRIRLQEQPLQILRILLEHPGTIVTRDELQQRVWPSDTFVDFDHGINNAIKRLREALGDTADMPRYVETLPRRGYRFIGTIERANQRFRSLVVLPLENLSRDPEQEYFAEGLTEALITTLAKIGDLRVVSRTSAMLYKGARKSTREIARELEVDTVVEGTVLRVGDRVRITAQLIDAQREAHLWAESYDRHLRDVLDLHSEVAQSIARQVQVKLTPQEQANLAQVQAVDPEAYEAYLKGRYHWVKRSRTGHALAIQHFQEAITKDPACAPAYAGLADAVAIMGLWGLLPPNEGCGRAQELALKAVDLDHSLGEAHTSLAWAGAHYDYDFASAEKEFERALELNPRYATAHLWFGMCLAMMGREDEASTELKRAIRLDPDWSSIRFGAGFVHWCAHRYDQALESLEKALELDPNFAQALAWMTTCHTAKLQFEQAIAAGQKAINLSERAPAPVALLGEAYAAAGLVDEAEKLLQELTAHRHVSAYFVSRVHAALGRADDALAWLETGYRQRGEWMILLKVDYRFDRFRDDPRFQELVRRLNFPE